MSSTAPYQSKLIPYQKEIFRMWYNERATLKNIQAFLKGKSVNISLSALSRFIKRRQLRSDPHATTKVVAKRSAHNNRNQALSELEKLMQQNKQAINALPQGKHLLDDTAPKKTDSQKIKEAIVLINSKSKLTETDMQLLKILQ